MKSNLQKLFLSSRFFSCDIEETVLLAGSPRSGTTWLLEVLAYANGYRAQNEAIELSRYQAAQKAGLEWRTYLGSKEQSEEKKRILQPCILWALGNTRALALSKRDDTRTGKRVRFKPEAHS